MPLTPYQEEVARLLSSNRTFDSRALDRFVVPGSPGSDDAVPHYGRPGGVLPRVLAE